MQVLRIRFKGMLRKQLLRFGEVGAVKGKSLCVFSLVLHTPNL